MDLNEFYRVRKIILDEIQAEIVEEGDDQVTMLVEQYKPEIAVLRRAEGLISTDRHNDYGDAVDDFEIVGEFWTTYLKARGYLVEGVEVDAKDVALLMSLLKIRRESTHPKEDNVDDAVGYLALSRKCHEKVRP